MVFIRYIILLVLSAALLVGAAVGLYRGQISSLGRHSHHVYVKASDPNGYWWTEAAYFLIAIAGGTFSIVGIRKSRDSDPY